MKDINVKIALTAEQRCLSHRKVRDDMEFPTIDEFAKEVSERALDEITYEGKTIREWAEIITKQQPCEDAISRKETLDKINALVAEYIPLMLPGWTLPLNIGRTICGMPSITLQPKVGKWIRIDKDKCKCDQCEIISFIAMYPNGNINYCPNCGAKMEEVK